MSDLPPCSSAAATVAVLPTEDIVLLAPGTRWQVPWELMMIGPFACCGLLDGGRIHHVTVPSMIASAVRRHLAPDAALVPSDYTELPVLAAETTLLTAAALVAQTGWELAVVLDREPRVITARSVYRRLVGADADGVHSVLVATNSGAAVAVTAAVGQLFGTVTG